MKLPQFTFFQGSTPTLVFALPYPLAADDVVYATFAQGGETVTEYTCRGTAYDPAPTGLMAQDADCPYILRIAMSQADTFLFAGGDCFLQLRIVKQDGRADTLFPVHGFVGKAQKGGVI